MNSNDKYNKKNLIIYSNLVKGAIFLLLLRNRSIWIIYIATFLFNFLLEFEGNTFSSLMANIFSKENIFKSASLINLIDSLSMIIAPVSASIIALHFRFNVNLILDICLFIITALIYSIIKISHQHIEKVEHSVPGGKGYIKVFKNKKILSTVVFWNIFMLCIGITAPLEISIIEGTLKMPSSYYGIGNTVEGIGMLIASGFIIGISANIWIYFIGAFLVGMTSTFLSVGIQN